MFYTLILFTFMNMFQSPNEIFKFESGSSTKGWKIVDDRVMGGKSQGDFSVNSDGFGVFEGYVTTENNGGFSSLRYNFDGIKTSGFEFIVLKIKGDGKSYQFRLNNIDSQRHSYIYTFTTNGLDQEISIPLKSFYPSFRGYRLNIPNFDADQIEQIAFLIGNKTKELFSLKIKSISLK
jgi:NADH dehydrogenase [ubiquinone] 1 alpha subcomplex assembly factor 1